MFVLLFCLILISFFVCLLFLCFIVVVFVVFSLFVCLFVCSWEEGYVLIYSNLCVIWGRVNPDGLYPMCH